VIVRRDAPAVAVTIGAAVTIVGSLRPWVASGTVDRSSYEIIDLVDRLGFAEGGLLEVALRAWPLMPLVVVAGAAAMWWRRHVVGAALSVVGGLYALCVALTVELAPSTVLLRIRSGPMITIAGAAVVLVASIVALVAPIRATRSRQVSRPGSGSPVEPPPAGAPRRS
jgi:hypothetical protein